MRPTLALSWKIFEVKESEPRFRLVIVTDKGETAFSGSISTDVLAELGRDLSARANQKPWEAI